VSEHPTFISDVDGFVVLGYLLTVCTTFWLIYLFHTKRYLFIKPSVTLLVWTHFLFQWPAAIFGAYYERALPDPYSFLLLLHGFVLIGLLVSQYVGLGIARDVFGRLSGGTVRDSVRPTLLLLAYCALVVGIYLVFVPLSKTGLYIIVASPELAALARSESLKQLGNPFVIYLYSTMTSGIAPQLAVLLAFLFAREVASHRVLTSIGALVALALLLLAASLPGARGNAVKLLLVIGVAILLRKGIPFRPLPFLLLIAVVLTPATLITLMREGREVTVMSFAEYLGNYIFSRAFIMPLQTGAFYVHYAQAHGNIGVAGVPRLAGLLGISGVDAPDLIGAQYAPGVASVRTSANGGFLLSYYSYFGLIALPLSLALLWILDFALLAYRRLSPALLLPAAAAISVSCLAFISSDYTTVLVTHGFLAILLSALILDRWVVDHPREGSPTGLASAK
jgi:hypothetical protein